MHKNMYWLTFKYFGPYISIRITENGRKLLKTSMLLFLDTSFFFTDAWILPLQCYKDANMIYLLTNICKLSALNKHKMHKSVKNSFKKAVYCLWVYLLYFCYARINIELVLLHYCKYVNMYRQTSMYLGPRMSIKWPKLAKKEHFQFFH